MASLFCTIFILSLLRKVKTDKADSVKIARYTLDSWANLKQYSLMDELRSQLKTMNRQFDFYMKHKTAMKNNPIGLIDQTYPGANTYFDSPAREDGSQKWVDFIDTYWHVVLWSSFFVTLVAKKYRLATMLPFVPRMVCDSR